MDFQKSNYLIKRLPLFAVTMALLVGCGEKANSSEPEPNKGENTEQGGNAATTDKFGLIRADVLSSFSKSLKGEGTEYSTPAPLDMKDYADASKYVWDIWKTAVNRQSGEKLPKITSHYTLTDWGETPTDFVWKVPEGDMKVFYSSKGSAPADGYPLYLYLHGSGTNNDQEWTYSAAWAQYFQDSPSAYFVPRSPQGGTGTRWFQPSKQAKWEQLLLQAMASGDIDPAKIYFMGVSEGAYGSQRLASFYADYLAGVGPIAGGEFLANCPPENLANTAFILQTGELDYYYGRAILTHSVDSILGALETAHPGHYKHKVDLQPGLGHGCNYTVTTPWLKNFKRNPNPKYVAWENYGMGGINNEPYRYREGFHNLRILTPSEDRSDNMKRTFYVMDIKGNNIDITVNNVTLTADTPVDPGTGTINVGITKTYTPATTGKLRVYLNNDLVNLSQPVTITVNGKKAFSGTVAPDMRHMVESTRFFFDPLRIYPAAVDVEIK